MDVNSLGYFQFNNLLETRTPFVLLLLGDADVGSWYKNIIKMHYDNISVRTTADDVLKVLTEKSVPKSFSIVVLDNNGIEAKKTATHLEENGYINGYYIRDGIQGMESEKSQ